MSDPKKNTINDFITKFKAANIKPSTDSSIITQAGNNIELVDNLLKTVMGTSDYTEEQINLLAKSPITPPLPSYNVRAPHVEVWINGALIVRPGQQDEPEFDVVDPNDSISLSNIRPKLDVWFKDFSLDMAFGGPVGTIQGELKLFSRDPLDFLSFLYDFVANVDEISGLPSVSLRFGWNIAHSNNQTNPTTLLSPKLDFLVTNVGMEDPSGQQQGSLFTLKLQDTGSSIYDNCAADFALKEDYPQQQLRILIERVMGVRLFTLDDLLSLNEEGESTSKAAANVTQYSYEELDPNNPSHLVILTDLLQQLQQQEQDKTGNIVVGTREMHGVYIVGDPSSVTKAEFTSPSIPYLSDDSLRDLIKLLKITETAEYNNKLLYNKDKDIADYITKTIAKYPGYMAEKNANSITSTFGSNRATLWYVNENNTTGIFSFIGPSNTWTIADSVNHMYMWFITQSYVSNDIKKATLRQILMDAATAAVHNYGFPPVLLTDNLKKDVIKLFSDGTQLTTSQTIKTILDKYNQTNPTNVKSILQTIYNQNPSLFTNTFFLNGKNPPLRLNSKSFRETITSLVSRIQCRWYPITNGTLVQNIAESQNASQDSYIKYNKWKNAITNDTPDVAQLQADYEKAKVKKAYGCRLVYASTFPKKYRTTSNTTYIEEKDISDGAFILLPNINPLHVTSDEMPLVYGPGGSRYPYLYGGAQNIKQVLLDKSGKLPQMFGEVIDAKVNYNNLTALIKANFNDDAAIAEAGTRISLRTTMRSGAAISSSTEQKKADREVRKRILTEQLNRLYPHLKDKNPEEIQKYIEESFEGKNGTFTEIRRDKNFRQYSTVYQGKRKMIKADADPASDPINKTYNAPLDPQSSARDFLVQRLGNMMYSPISISLQVMGDPFLIRQGIGAFELIHYFIDKEGIGLRYNYLLSGVFLVTSINHTISAGNYYTNIKAFKIPPVENTFTNTIDTWRKQVDKKDTIETTTRSYETDTELTTALNDLMTKNINLELLATGQTGTMTSVERITKETVVNTEQNNPYVLDDIDKFYFDL